MTRLDRLQEIIDAAKPINPNAEKMLKELFDKAIPMVAYFKKDDIEEAIFGDAIDKGLSATDIRIAIDKMYDSGAYNGYSFLLGGVYYLAGKQLEDERAADVARMNEAAKILL